VPELREEAPGDLSGIPPDLIALFRQWKPESQQKAMTMLRQFEVRDWHPFFCTVKGCDGLPHANGSWGWNHARADQQPPSMSSPDWLTLCFSGGRGAGKSRTGSEITHRMTSYVGRLFLVAATGPDLRETMVEGVSGVLATAAPGKRPLWEPSKKRLTWPNGAIAQGFSAEEPDRLRGPESGFVWADEPAHYPLIEDVWRNMLLGLRLGKNPKVVATTTPKPTKWMKELIKDPLTITRRVSTYANLGNLADAFKRTVLDRFEGTRLGRQELHGEILEDVEGALWTWDMITTVDTAPPLLRVVIGVDPAGSIRVGSDETGIIVLGVGYDKHLYALADRTGRYSPRGWAERANSAYEEFGADAIVAEKNYGGDMVKHTLQTSGYGGARIILVNSRRGKAIRAEPIVARYEQHLVSHVGGPGVLTEMEDEMTSWVPGQGPSPNRVDALVHGATELLAHIAPVAIADPNKLLRRHLRAV
jgi:phage terminase large subunit-like protein